MAYCDICGSTIYDQRILCLECSTTSESTVDFCDNPHCITMPIQRPSSPLGQVPMHLPTHSLVKIYEDIHYYHDTARVIQEALKGRARANEALHRGTVGQSVPALEPIVESVTVDDESPVASDAGSEDANEQSNEKLPPSVTSITCLSCAKPITDSCWYCINCPGM